MQGNAPSPAPAKLLWTAAETAKALSISPRSLWALSKSGEIPVVRLGKRAVRYDPEALRRFVAQRQEARP